MANKTDSVTTYQMAKEHRGRAFYLVTYPYDPNQEHFHSGYSAKVWVWADNGVAFSIMFGNGWGYCNLDKPFRNEELKYVMPYKWSPPRKQNREDSQEGTGKTQESTEGEIYYIK